jgi:CRP-like cAMP-binding protein
VKDNEVIGLAPAFQGMTEQETAFLEGASQRLALRDDQTIFSRGDAATSVYLTLSGAVRISTLAPSGKRIVVEIFKANELFGEIAGIDGGARTADATAMGPVELLAIPVTAFRDVLKKSPELANNILQTTIERLRRTYSLLEDASLRPVELRLAKQILYLVKFGAHGSATIRLQVRMQQDELADLLGVTTRSIINVLNKWRADELVQFDGRTAQVTILDMERFRALTLE